MGAASVDMGTGRISWILHGKSDIFALQLIHSVIHFVLLCVCIWIKLVEKIFLSLIALFSFLIITV